MIITAGIYKGRKMSVPDEKITRPTLSKVRMGVFNTLYSILGDFSGLTFLDLFGGSGLMGLEALSRGFKDVIVCEKNMHAVEIIKKNYSSIGLTPNLVVGDSLKFIEKETSIYDVVYVDPPYKSGICETIIPKLKGKIIIAEHSEPLKISGLNVIKEKNYGGKYITFLSRD